MFQMDGAGPSPLADAALRQTPGACWFRLGG